MRFFLLLSSFVLISSCGKEPLAYLHKTPEELHVSKLYPVTTLESGNVNIVLVFDVSGSMYDEIKLVLESVEEALDSLTTVYYKIPWQLGVLGANVATTTSSTLETTYSIGGSDILMRKDVVAMNFRGFPEDSILELQNRRENVGTILDTEIKNQIRKEQAPISYQTPHYGEEIKKVLNEVLNVVRGTMEIRRPLFRSASSDEMSFAPVAVALRHNPTFMRSPDDHLAIFYFTDVKEQSHSWETEVRESHDPNDILNDPKQIQNRPAVKKIVSFGGDAWNGMTSEEYHEELLMHVNGKKEKIFMGGGFTAEDLKITEQKCTSEGGFKITGSRYEDLIMRTAKTQKAIISNCTSTESFKQLFIQLFDQLVRKIEIPEFSIADTGVPICASTLKMFYKGEPLPQGNLASGGIWQFDWEFNIIRFNTMEFIDDDDEHAHVRIEFDMDNGFDGSC